jgi:hypothetical protein
MRGGNLICFESEKPRSIAFQRRYKLQATNAEPQAMSGMQSVSMLAKLIGVQLALLS